MRILRLVQPVRIAETIRTPEAGNSKALDRGNGLCFKRKRPIPPNPLF